MINPKVEHYIIDYTTTGLERCPDCGQQRQPKPKPKLASKEEIWDAIRATATGG